MKDETTNLIIMKNSKVRILMGFTIVSCISGSLYAQSKVDFDQALNEKQQQIVPIAVYTAKGDMPSLSQALNDGLDSGLTVNEIKEILIHLYAYTGFPRSLNGLSAFQSVLEQRREKGIADEVGKEASPLPDNKTSVEFGSDVLVQLIGTSKASGVREFAPAIDTILKSHLFGDLFGRDVLDFQSREIATISALTSMKGVENQLGSHLKIARNIGMTDEQIKGIAFEIAVKAGWQEGQVIAEKMKETLGNYPENTNKILIEKSGVSVQKVTFPNRHISVVGNIYFPSDYDNTKKYPAIVVAHPAGGVKEQVSGFYAEMLAERGFVALAFDASYQGESGGTPRFLDDPAVRTEDLRAAADYMTTRPDIDANRLGVLGICAGGGFVIKAAQTEHRYKAVATVSMADLGQLRRDGLNGALKARMRERLDEVGRQRTLEARGEPLKYVNIVANTEEEAKQYDSRMYQQGYEYYRVTHRHPNSQNKYTFTSLDKLMAFTALDHVEMISPRPLLLIAGSEAESFYYSQEAYDKAGEPKELFSVEGATHIDLYYKPEFYEQVIKKLNDFYKRNL
jgi:fermentation-respiration switch protein FrsA (DUF1100 family)/alkylhydroperoxidase/carboxymuconolactone decarboxylase family protein YurZ